MSAPVDVLAVIARIPCRCLSVAQLGERDAGCDRCQAIAAVDELIKADKAFDRRALAESAEEWDAIIARRTAALARVGGTP